MARSKTVFIDMGVSLLNNVAYTPVRHPGEPYIAHIYLWVSCFIPLLGLRIDKKCKRLFLH